MELLHGGGTDVRALLSDLESVLEKRRRGAHPVELNGYFSTLAYGMRRQPSEAAPPLEEDVRLPDGGTVRLVWRRAPSPGRRRSPQGVVLILPGLNTSSRWPAVQRTAVAFCRRGFDTAVLDYRGVGGLELTSAMVGSCDAWRDLPAAERKGMPPLGLVAHPKARLHIKEGPSPVVESHGRPGADQAARCSAARTSPQARASAEAPAGGAHARGPVGARGLRVVSLSRGPRLRDALE